MGRPMPRVAYVASGQGWPHLYIDQAIQRALAQLGVPTTVYQPASLPSRLREFSKQSFGLVLALHGRLVPPEVTDHWRAAGIPSALWLVEDPYEIDAERERVGRFDLVFTIEEDCLETLRSFGAPSVHHLPLGANEAVFRPQAVGTRHQADLTLVGVAFRNRREILDQAAPGLVGLRLKLVGPGWEELGRQDVYGPGILPAIVPPAEAAKYYAGAAINLNIHRSPSDMTLNQNQTGCTAASPNNRLFEIAASGGFILSDLRPGIPAVFQPNREVVFFEGVDDLIAKVRFYLARPDLRQQVAQRARQEVLAKHTYRHRLQTILDRVGLTGDRSFFGRPSYSYWEPWRNRRSAQP